MQLPAREPLDPSTGQPGRKIDALLGMVMLRFEAMGFQPQESHTTSRSSLAQMKGQSVVEFLAWFLQTVSGVKYVRFVTYTPEPNLSERLRNQLTPEEEAIRDEAQKTCHGNGIPFWDALLGICMKRDSIPERLLRTAYSHSSTSPDHTFELSPGEVTSERVSKMIDELPDPHGLVFSSKLEMKSGDIAHIPMLDFRCPCSPANSLAIEKILSMLGQRWGVIAESGRSYHYYGTELFSRAEWENFMARALLFAPIVDPRYVAHRLVDGECRLKIAASRNAGIPRIVNAITDSN